MYMQIKETYDKKKNDKMKKTSNIPVLNKNTLDTLLGHQQIELYPDSLQISYFK